MVTHLAMVTQTFRNITAGLATSLSLVFFLVLPAACVSMEDIPTISTVMVESQGVEIAFHVTPATKSGQVSTIVLDAGGGGDSSYWDDLVPVLAKQTGARIITYDRAGFGESEERPGPFKLDDAVSDLAQGLRDLGATDNVILVPHSFGGEIAISLARKHPEWIAGAVLVDGSVPQYFTEEALGRQAEAYAPVIAAMRELKDQTKQTRSQLAFFDSFVGTAREFHKVSWPKEIPCTVILAEKTPFPESPVDAQMWRDAEAQFANEATNRELIIAEGSSHDVAHDRPDIIIQAVVEMAARVH